MPPEASESINRDPSYALTYVIVICSFLIAMATLKLGFNYLKYLRDCEEKRRSDKGA